MNLKKNVSTIKGLAVHGPPCSLVLQQYLLEEPTGSRWSTQNIPATAEKPTPNSQLTGRSLRTLGESVSV